MEDSTKKVLLIAYFFPPIGGIASAGAQRAVKFAKYLPDFGWSAVVLTVREDDYEDYYAKDVTLMDKLPADLKIVRTSVIRWFSKALQLRTRVKAALAPLLRRDGSDRAEVTEEDGNSLRNPDRKNHSPGTFQALKDSVSDLFEVPDGQAGWILPAVRQGLETIRKEDIRAIMATGKPWSALVIGAVLSKLTGKPLFTDFRDPWMTNPYRVRASPLKNWGEAWYEGMVVQQSSRVVANTDELRNEFQNRFPSDTSEKFVALHNGFDPADMPRDSGGSTPGDGVFKILHAGFLYGLRDPRIFLEGLALAIRDRKVDGKRVEVVFLGSVELSYDLNGVLAELDLVGNVDCRGQVPFEQVARSLERSDLLLLLQPGTKTQIPSKLFEYIASGKPILAVTPEDGGTARIVGGENLGKVASPDDPAQIAEAICGLYSDWLDGTAGVGLNSESRQKFNIKKITSKLAALLDSNT